MSKRLFAVSALVVTAMVTSVTWAEVPTDVETAACAYRIRVYTTFRQNRAEYDKRIERGDEVLAAWRRSGETKDAEQAALYWFLAASEASVRGAESPLPQLADPSVFEPQPEQVAKKSARKSGRLNNRRPSRSARSNAQPKPTTRSGGLASTVQGFGQMVGDRVNNLFGSQTPKAARTPKAAQTPQAPVTDAPIPAEVTDADALISLQTEDSATSSDADAAATLRQINESIEGHNAVVGGIRDQLQSEWDFNPQSADELLAKMETLVASELSLAGRISALDPAYQADVQPMESANDLIGEIDERLEVLRLGADNFASLGFDEETAKRLFDRVDQMRKQLDY